MFTLKFTKQIVISFCLFVIISPFTGQLVSAQINIGGITISKPKRSDKPKTDQPANPNKNDSIRPSPTPEQNAPVSNEIQFNKKAPADYDANLNVGDQAITVSYQGVESVKILAKSGGNYKAIDTDDPRLIFWFKANSVYPYFDKNAFRQIYYDYSKYLAPYLPCYAQKHNLNAKEYFDSSGITIMNAQRAQQALQANAPKLAEAGNLLKTKLQARPDTYLTANNNPAIWDEITSQQDEYMQCVMDSIANKPSPVLPVFLEDIQKAKRDVAHYEPGKNIYLVSAGAESEELLRAVSKKAREEWAAKWLKQPAMRAKFDAAWDDLAAVAKEKIPLYKPSAAAFQVRYPAGEKLLMDSFKSTSTLKIFRIGTDTAGWNIQKENYGLLPIYRYKDVRVYLRDSSADHPYCQVVTARIKQDYSGGGTYNSTIYRAPVSEEIYGCP